MSKTIEQLEAENAALRASLFDLWEGMDEQWSECSGQEAVDRARKLLWPEEEAQP